MVCVPFVKTPPFVPSAGVRIKLLPLVVAPLAFEVPAIDPTPVIPAETGCQVAFPLASLVKTDPVASAPPVTFKVAVYKLAVLTIPPTLIEPVKLMVPPLKLLLPPIVCGVLRSTKLDVTN